MNHGTIVLCDKKPLKASRLVKRCFDYLFVSEGVKDSCALPPKTKDRREYGSNSSALGVYHIIVVVQCKIFGKLQIINHPILEVHAARECVQWDRVEGRRTHAAHDSHFERT